MGITATQFAKLAGVNYSVIYRAIRRHPPKGGVSVDLQATFYPKKELARSVRAYCQERARELREEYRGKIAALVDLARAAGEMMEDDDGEA